MVAVGKSSYLPRVEKGEDACRAFVKENLAKSHGNSNHECDVACLEWDLPKKCEQRYALEHKLDSEAPAEFALGKTAQPLQTYNGHGGCFWCVPDS